MQTNLFQTIHLKKKRQSRWHLEMDVLLYIISWQGFARWTDEYSVLKVRHGLVENSLKIMPTKKKYFELSLQSASFLLDRRRTAKYFNTKDCIWFRHRIGRKVKKKILIHTEILMFKSHRRRSGMWILENTDDRFLGVSGERVWWYIKGVQLTSWCCLTNDRDYNDRKRLKLQVSETSEKNKYRSRVIHRHFNQDETTKLHWEEVDNRKIRDGLERVNRTAENSLTHSMIKNRWN